MVINSIAPGRQSVQLSRTREVVEHCGVTAALGGSGAEGDQPLGGQTGGGLGMILVKLMMNDDHQVINIV